MDVGRTTKKAFGGFFPWGRETPNLLFASCFPLTATQKKFQDSCLKRLIKPAPMECRKGKLFFSIFSQNWNPKNFSKTICCKVSCLEVVTSLGLSCAEWAASAQDVALIACKAPGLCLVAHRKHQEQRDAFSQRCTEPQPCTGHIPAKLQRFGYCFYCL